jgi:hypothetical protein
MGECCIHCIQSREHERVLQEAREALATARTWPGFRLNEGKIHAHVLEWMSTGRYNGLSNKTILRLAYEKAIEHQEEDIEVTEFS